MEDNKIKSAKKKYNCIQMMLLFNYIIFAKPIMLNALRFDSNDREILRALAAINKSACNILRENLLQLEALKTRAWKMEGKAS